MVDGEGNKLIGQSFSISVSGRGHWVFESSPAVLSHVVHTLSLEPFLYRLVWKSEILSTLLHNAVAL